VALIKGHDCYKDLISSVTDLALKFKRVCFTNILRWLRSKTDELIQWTNRALRLAYLPDSLIHWRYEQSVSSSCILRL